MVYKRRTRKRGGDASKSSSTLKPLGNIIRKMSDTIGSFITGHGDNIASDMGSSTSHATKGKATGSVGSKKGGRRHITRKRSKNKRRSHKIKSGMCATLKNEMDTSKSSFIQRMKKTMNTLRNNRKKHKRYKKVRSITKYNKISKRTKRIKQKKRRKSNRK